MFGIFPKTMDHYFGNKKNDDDKEKIKEESKESSQDEDKKALSVDSDSPKNLKKDSQPFGYHPGSRRERDEDDTMDYRDLSGLSESKED
ncbi:MAG: hypothetical protein QY321_00560 [Patescibacteria group bacterium]|nr:MAG: hypothetical protein QY321_00560 [Patescibacteria group bacterium]